MNDIDYTGLSESEISDIARMRRAGTSWQGFSRLGKVVEHQYDSGGYTGLCRYAGQTQHDAIVEHIRLLRKRGNQ